MTHPTEGMGIIDFYALHLKDAPKSIDLDDFLWVRRYLINRCGIPLNSPSPVQIACIDEAIRRVKAARSLRSEVAA